MNSILKNRPPYPFETIAVAVAFSPTLKSILENAKRLSKVFGAKLILIHIGDKTERKEAELNELLHSIRIKESKTEIIWDNGDVEQKLLHHLKENVADLFIIGALQEEHFLKKYFISSISRSIMRKAKCSTLVLTDPEKIHGHLKRIVVNGNDNPKTQLTLKTAAYIAEADKVKEMYVIKEVYLPGMSSVIADGQSDDEARKLEQKYIDLANETCKTYLENLPELSKTKIKTRVMNGQPGHCISQFARTINADLMIINSPDKPMGFLDRVFTHDMEHIISNLTCNLLIVHSRGF